MKDQAKHLAETMATQATYGGSTVAVGSAGSLVMGLTPAEWSVIFGAGGFVVALIGLAYTIWNGERKHRAEFKRRG